MAERVEAVGGTFTIEAKPGAGTLVEVRLPAGEPRPADESAAARHTD